MKLGDAVEKNPIVHAIGKATGCVDPATNKLRPDSPCAKRKKALNNFSDAIYDSVWGKAKEIYDKLHSK
jgi:hypothetical protein